MRKVVAFGLLAALIQSGTALAQSAPEAGAPATVPQRKIEIRTYSMSGRNEVEIIRGASAQGDPATWLNEAEVPAEAWNKTEQITSISLSLVVSAAGRITSCKPESGYVFRAPAWATQLCAPLVKRARFVPALTAEGKRTSVQMSARVDFTFDEKRRVVVNPPMPIPGYKPPGFDPFLVHWPPLPDWLNAFASPPAFKRPVEQPGGAALAGPAIGLIVADPKSGDVACRAVLYPDDESLGDKACQFAREQLQPEWAATVRFPIRRWPLLLSPEGSGFRVIQPDDQAIRGQGIEPAELARLRALWRPHAKGAGKVRMSGEIGLDGRPKSCRIHGGYSSGSDRADVAACRLFMTEARFAPPRDMFGQPGRLSGWIELELTS